MTAFLNNAFSLGNRARFLAAIAGLFVVAQLIVAVHLNGKPDHNLGHSPATCTVCIAAPASSDPALLTFEIARPAETLFDVEQAHAEFEVAANVITDARPRAPPLA